MFPQVLHSLHCVSKTSQINLFSGIFPVCPIFVSWTCLTLNLGVSVASSRDIRMKIVVLLKTVCQTAWKHRLPMMHVRRGVYV